MLEEVGDRKCVLLIVTVGRPVKQAAWEFVSTAGNEVGHEDRTVADITNGLSINFSHQ